MRGIHIDRHPEKRLSVTDELEPRSELESHARCQAHLV